MELLCRFLVGELRDSRLHQVICAERQVLQRKEKTNPQNENIDLALSLLTLYENIQTQSYVDTWANVQADTHTHIPAAPSC